MVEDKSNQARIPLTVEIDPDNLVTSVCDALNLDDLFGYIVAIDAQYHDWDLTEKLRDFFVEEMLGFEIDGEEDDDG